MKVILANCPVSLVIALAGCAATGTPLDDGYRIGDLSELQAQYCATADPNRRAILLALMHRAGVTLPASGVCTDLLDLVSPEHLLDIDVEQAQQDRERFEERRDAGGDTQASQD